MLLYLLIDWHKSYQYMFTFCGSTIESNILYNLLFWFKRQSRSLKATKVLMNLIMRSTEPISQVISAFAIAVRHKEQPQLALHFG